MKKALFLAAGFLFLSGGAKAASQLIQEVSISTAPAKFSVSVSTASLTKINPSRGSFGLRSGILFNQPNDNNSIMYGELAGCSGTSVSDSTTTTKIIEISPTDRDRYIALDANTCLWLFSTYTSAETIYGQEIGQK